MIRKFFVILALALLPLFAHAKIVGKSTGTLGSVLLTDEPCSMPGLEKSFKLSVVDHAANKLDEGCWVRVNDTVYLISPILGGQGEISKDAFDWFEKDSTRSPNT